MTEILDAKPITEIFRLKNSGQILLPGYHFECSPGYQFLYKHYLPEIILDNFSNPPLLSQFSGSGLHGIEHSICDF